MARYLLPAALAFVFALGAAAPALADRGDWREHQWREHEWRENEMRDREWHGYGWRDNYPYYAAPPVVVSPPPAAVYYPPPVVMPPPIAPGFNIILPIHIH